MPTLVTVPATTGPKSHDIAPEVLLMELPVVWADTVALLKSARPSTPNKVAKAAEIIDLWIFSAEPEDFCCREGGVDMISPEVLTFFGSPRRLKRPIRRIVVALSLILRGCLND